MSVFANLLGHIIPLLAGLLLIPPTLRALGAERFGVLVIAWAILAVAGVVDHAMSRGIVRELARGNESPVSARLLWLGGAVIGAIVGLAAAILLRNAELLALGAIVPPTLAFSASRSRLEAERRFVTAAFLGMLFSLATYVMPWLVAVHGNGSFAIMFLGIAAARATLNAGRGFSPPTHVGGRLKPRPTLLIRFTTGLMIANGIPAIAAALDRWLLATFAGIAAVAPYGIAAEIFARTLIIPMSVTTVVYPAAAAGETIFSWRRARLALAFAAAAIVIAFFTGPPLLRWWLGASVGNQVATLIPPFVLAFLFACAGTIPAIFLQARGALNRFIRLRLVVALLVLAQPLLITRWGADGAAWGMTLRYACDAALLTFYATFRNSQRR